MKRKTTTRTLILLAILATAFTACKKDKDEDAITKENIVGSYRITVMTVKYGTDPEEDLLSYLDACQRDNIITFELNNTYTYNDVGLICNPPTNDDGSWDLPNKTTLTLDGTNMTIKSFKSGKLDLVYTDNSSSPAEVYNYTFTRQ